MLRVRRMRSADNPVCYYAAHSRLPARIVKQFIDFIPLLLFFAVYKIEPRILEIAGHEDGFGVVGLVGSVVWCGQSDRSLKLVVQWKGGWPCMSFRGYARELCCRASPRAQWQSEDWQFLCLRQAVISVGGAETMPSAMSGAGGRGEGVKTCDQGQR